MKKSLFAMLALAFCLSACTPAASQSTGEAPVTATAEAAPAEETAEVAIVGTLRNLSFKDP